ncbi:hypothetical protein [Nocardioides massiliensis]|uniref:Phage tail protein n=1 Tax=Nocardioides massiliensis TaxID=1325935 RepID=A0ABT9NIY7_9ACTN|nr:hypothetical protein [Nocardioides massiliensis]MDP9820378.1 hypothetical protein [Nocardioides massiliensis]
MTWPRFQFTAGPSADAEVRLDLNAEGIELADSRVLVDGFGFGMPELDGEPGARGRAWGVRTQSLPWKVTGSKAAALALLGLLARELTRQENWLRVQLSPSTEPRWLHTYAASADQVSLNQVYWDAESDTWRTTLSVPADPFALGPRVDMDPVTVTNSPIAGTHPMQVKLPPVLGEVPAPALVVVEKAAAGGMLGPLVAVTNEAATVHAAGSWGPAVGSAVTAAGYLAGSYRPTSGGLADWAVVGTWEPGVLPQGRRRALLRVGATPGAGAVLLRAVVGGLAMPPVLVQCTDQVRWVDLGSLPYPMPDDDGLGAAPAVPVVIAARRARPGGELRLDDRLLLVDGAWDADLLKLTARDGGTGPTRLAVNADARRARAVIADAAVPPPAASGGWPHLHPGRDNHLLVAQNVDPLGLAGRNDDAASTTTVRVSYQPRYLWGV